MTTSFLNGRVINHSNKWLLIIETTTFAGKKDKPPVLTHKLGSKMKTPKNIDADGFKHLDGEAIDEHREWWKIRNMLTADIYDHGADLKVCVLYKIKVKDNHFGPNETDESENWGESLKYVTSIIKDKKGRTLGYEVEGYGRVDIDRGIDLAESGEIDNAVVVKGSKSHHLRTKPDGKKWNNLVIA